MEMSMSATKNAILESKRVQDEALAVLQAQRKKAAQERAEELRITQEKKKKRLLRLDQKERKRAQKLADGGDDDSDDDDDDDDDQQLVQISNVPTSVKLMNDDDDDDDDDDDFGFNPSELIAAAKAKEVQSNQKDLFELSSAKDQSTKIKAELDTKLELQSRVAELLQADRETTKKLDKKLSDPTQRRGRFQVQLQSNPIGSRNSSSNSSNAPSARDLLAMAHGFTSGVKKTPHVVRLQSVPRIHSSTDQRNSSNGISASILDRGATVAQKVARKKAVRRRG
jgi:hypothetical protein